MVSLGNKEYTDREKELIWFGMGLGMATLGQSMRIPDAVMGQCVSILSESVKQNVPDMWLSPEEAKKLLKDSPRLWTKDFENIMEGVSKISIDVSNSALKTLGSDKMNESHMSPDEKKAYNRLIKMKAFLTSKGHPNIDSHDKLIKAFESLSPYDNRELTKIIGATLDEDVEGEDQELKISTSDSNELSFF